MRGRALAGFLGLGAVLLGLASGPLGAPAARAAVEPGTPIAVAPGVPGNGRGWELVTPADVVSALPYTVRAISVDSDRIVYTTFGPLPGAPEGTPLPAIDVAERSSNGWANGSIDLPYPGLSGASDASPLYLGPVALSPNLTSSIWATYLPLRPGESSEEVGLFRRGPDGKYTLLAEIGPGRHSIGASADTSHVVFMAEKHLLPGDGTRTEGQSIYEIDGSTLRLVDVGNDGSLLSACGSTLLSGEYEVSLPDVISRDGKRIFFTTHPSYAGPARVYLREGGASTTEISASQCDLPSCGAAQDVSFVGATPSGSSAFLVTEERLTDADTNSYADLYRYDAGSGELILLSDEPEGTELAVNASSVRFSADGSRVYFTGIQRSGSHPGADYLYLADAGGTHAIAPAATAFQVSADGRYALLTTSTPLLESDTDGRTDLYRYDAASGTVAQVSASTVGEGGGTPSAEPSFYAQTASSHLYRAISNDGSRIFFSTYERLIQEDRNEVADVYEWANGRLGLISSGEGKSPAVYLGSSPDGRTVLFRTSSTLLASDRDGGDLDFYVARLGGGFSEPSLAGGCGAASCRAAGQGRLDRALPASAKPRRGAISLRLPGPAARRGFVASGQITLLAEVPKPGRLFAEARARLGGHLRTLASAEAEVAQPGPVRLRMRLSEAARHSLAAGKDLRVGLRLRLSGLSSTRRLSFELEGAR